MELEEFHRDFRSEMKRIISERIDNGEGPFPSSELVFAEMVMEHVAEAGICEEPTICHWKGSFGNARLRITGYALSSDESSLDLFVTHYFDSEDISNLRNSEAVETAQQGIRFLFRSADGKLESRIDPSHPIRTLVSTIREKWAAIDRVRVLVITDGLTKAKRFSKKEVHHKMVLIEAVDIERLYRHTEGKPRDELMVSLVQELGIPLPCVHVPDPDADYDYALAALPGQLVRELYIRFGQRMFEANVRTFLGMKRAVNRGIVETLKNEPEHFLAFNNGMVLVCDEAGFERKEDGHVGLSFMKGFQIVNGGQTASSIYFASRDDRTIDLSHAMIPVKIIILRGNEDESRERLISNVSRYANSQNAVRLSDLSANRPFHIQLEKLANETWCPDGATRWFYERAMGAYNVLLLREGNTPAKRRRLREMIPTNRKLTKSAVARYHESWRGKPGQVSLGGEKNFAAFMAALDEDPNIVPNPLDAKWYKEMIAKVILFQTVERMIKTKEAKEKFEFRQGWINIATYVVAVVSDRLGDRIDLERIWLMQSISDNLRNILWGWAVLVNEKFNQIASGKQFSEVAKYKYTWSMVKEVDYPMRLQGVPELKKYSAK